MHKYKSFVTFLFIGALPLFISLRAQDSSWHQQTLPFDNGTLSDLTFVDEHKGWAVGQDYSNGEMIILHTDNSGAEWSIQNVPQSNAFLSRVQMVDSEKGYAVGTQYSAAIGVYTLDGGINWQEQSLPPEVLFVDGLLISDNDTWAAGGGDSNAVILQLLDDSTWTTAFSVPVNGFFNALNFVDEVGWAAGADWSSTFGEPLLAKTEDGGVSWNLVDLPVSTGFLTDVSFINVDTGWAVGSADEDFLILQTYNGGNSWMQIDSIGVQQFSLPPYHSSRLAGFNKVGMLRFYLDLYLVYGIISKQIFSDTGPVATYFKFLLVSSFIQKYDLGIFDASLLVGMFMHTHQLIPPDLEAGPINRFGNRRGLMAGDLVCYAYGSDRSIPGLDKPVIFKKVLRHSFLNEIEIRPNDIEITVGDSVYLYVTGKDQYGDEMMVEAPRWSMDNGGTLSLRDSFVVFRAEEAGDYFIKCKEYYTGLQDSIAVTIEPLSGMEERVYRGLPSINLKSNPVNQELIVEMRSHLSGDVQLSVYNSVRQLKHHQNKTIRSGENTFTWNTSRVSPGLYIVHVRTKENCISKPFIVIH